MAQTIAEESPFSILDKVKTKNTDIRIVRGWEVGISKTTIIKFNLPFNDDSKRLLPLGLRKGSDRYQNLENERHLAFAEALGQKHKTVACRGGALSVATADERMETPKEGRASANFFWGNLREKGFVFVDGEYFKNIRKDGSTTLVIELKFVHESRKKDFLTALEASGIKPTLLFNELRERLQKNLFCKSWHRCFAFSNSAHLEVSKTYNFTGTGFRGRPLYELIVDNKGRVTFVEINK